MFLNEECHLGGNMIKTKKIYHHPEIPPEAKNCQVILMISPDAVHLRKNVATSANNQLFPRNSLKTKTKHKHIKNYCNSP